MKRILFTLLIFCIAQNVFSQGCVVTASAPRDTIVCGDAISLSAFGQAQGIALLSENFNNGSYGPGWQSTQTVMWNNPCSAGGVDGTTHMWMGNTSPVPRALTTASFNLSSCANAGVTICFDMLFATQGNSAPCEGPDEPQEGVYLQYSINNGATWIDINYFDPNGGNDPQLINWKNWCFPVPPAALTANTRFRWFQDADSGQDYDHWGVDNVVIYCNDPTYNIVWTHDGYNAGPVGGVNPTPVAPHSTTSYPVVMTNGTITCRDTVRIVVVNPIVQVNAGNDTVVCTGQCATLNATAKVIKNPAKTPTYRNLQPDTADITSFGGVINQGANVNINITTLNMTNVLPGSIVSVCIDRIRMTGLGLGAGNLQFYLLCPDGTSIVLMPDSTATGNAGFITYNTLFNQTCFYPAGPPVSSGTPPYTNNFGTSESFDNLAGCTANGVWTLAVVPQSGFGGGTIVTSGWSITFNDPEIAYTGDFTWTPTTGMTNSTTLNPTVCPPPTAYTLTVSDTAGCVTQSDVVNVTTQACCALSASATSVQPTCGQSNGSINITPVPAGSYSFAWSDGPSTLQNRTGLAAGTYTVTVTSTVTPTCTFDTTIVLNSSGSLSVSFSNQVNPTCAGNDGSITVTLAGGTPVYAITIDTGGAPFTINSPIAGSQNIPGLDAGTVTVSVVDGGSCTASATATIVAPSNCCTVTATSTTTQPTCGQSNGAINITPNPAGSYNYAWSDGPSTLQNRTGLAAGNYTVTITSTTVATCTFVTSISLNSNSSLTLTFSNPQNPGCGGSNGALTATIAGGTAPFSLTIDTGGGSIIINPATSPQSVTGLPAGTITGTVQDAAGCTASANTTLASPTAPTLLFDNPSDPTCAGNDGSVRVTLAGGTGPYTITVDTGSGPFTLNSPIPGQIVIPGLHAGTVTASVSDANSCTANATVTLTAATNCCTHTVSAALVQPTCGQADGSITLTTSNGSGNYTYAWGGGETIPVLNNIGAGNYSVTITDNGFTNCFIDTVLSLSSNSSLSLTITNPLNPTCAGNDGAITVNLSGGTAPYNVTVDTGGALFTFPVANAGSTPITGLPPGTISLSANDFANCQANASVTLATPICCTIQVDATIVPPTCGQNNASITVNILTPGVPPYSYSIDGVSYQSQNSFSNVAPGNYTAIGRDVNLCADTFAVVVPVSGNSLIVAIATTNITCFGANDGTATANVTGGTPNYTYVWNGGSSQASLNGLASGNYSVTVSDATACTGSASANISEPALLAVNLGNDTTACEGTSIVVSAPAGFTTYVWSSTETTQSITPLVAGTYSVTVTDANNCTASDAVDINLVPAPLVNLGDDKIVYEGENIGIFANINEGNGTGGTYNWMPDTLLTCADCQNPVAYGADTITYVLVYTDDYGCTGTDDITLNVLPVKDIFWPNAFSPNGDGNNDVFLPYGSGVKLISWQLFNRWGEKVFESDNFFLGCDGTYKGKPLPMGVYVYSAKVVLMNNAERAFKGSVTLIR